MIIDEARSSAPPSSPSSHEDGKSSLSRAVVVSGSYGAGHDAAAREIQHRLTTAGFGVDVLDIAELFPLGIGHALRRAYFTQLKVAPWSWRALLSSLDAAEVRRGRLDRSHHPLVGRLPAARVAAAVQADARLVVSTHPFASQALGYLRERGALDVPTVTYLTDASVHSVWVHRSVDRHLAVHEEAARQATALGAADVRVIAPLTPQVALPGGHERLTLRSRLGLGPTEQVALIASGSEGAGDVRRSALDVRATGRARPVVLCGRNERLRRVVEREPGVLALGWLDGLTDTIRGADCLLQNSGGFTTLEALALGTPLISYRPLPGHGEASAQALAKEGLAPWPQTASELGAAIDQASLRSASPPRRWERRASLLDSLPAQPAAQLVGG
ncbi:MAG: galactosyldiacylglycerol synthase [Nocardioides sp.]|uniref:MGDG synthase family glycosyltransferase n=1 Tax=Nocardioides sp. TaxID=35761 RepID=UPI0039E2779C